MFGLSLVGTARPVVLGEVARLPPDYVQLMRTWGPGALMSHVELPDPTENDGRFDFLQAQFRLRAQGERVAGRWGQLTDDDIARGVVLGVTARGCGLLGLAADRLLWLDVDGDVIQVGDLQGVVNRLRSRWDGDPLLPQLYVAGPSRRPAFITALEAGDETAADAALARVLEVEHPVDAPLALAHHLVTTAGIDRALRASYAEQCLRMAKRKAGDRMKAVDIRALRDALKAGEVPPALRAALDELVVMKGIFAGEGDRTEVALLEELVAHPDDAATRLVLADHLEARGELARAEALRAEPTGVAPLADAAERGFIARAGAPPVEGAKRLQDYVETWKRDSPAMDVAPLTAALAALHPQERQGYALLLETLSRNHGDVAQTFLEREIAKAWPLLVLALRSDCRQAALFVLLATRTTAALPYILDAIRHPTRSQYYWSDHGPELAEAFLELGGKLSKTDVDELVGWLRRDASTREIEVAARLLVKSAKDDRVFEAYLRCFCEAHPFSVQALSKRRKEPRVQEVLCAEFARQEAASLKDGRILSYSRDYGLLAAYLKKLGVAGAAEALERYRKNTRMIENQLYPRTRDL